MSSSQELYNRLNEKLRELVHVRNGKQVTNWIWIVVGILQSQSSSLSKIANCLPMETQAASRVMLIRRWLMNPHVKVWMFYKKILEHVLSDWSAVEAYIILDGVMIFGDRWQVFRVSLLHGCRAIPLAWKIVPGKGLVKVSKLKSMLEKVQRFLKQLCQAGDVFSRCGFSRLGLGTIMRKIGLELRDSGGLQHLYYFAKRNLRSVGSVGSCKPQSVFPRRSC